VWRGPRIDVARAVTGGVQRAIPVNHGDARSRDVRFHPPVLKEVATALDSVGLLNVQLAVRDGEVH